MKKLIASALCLLMLIGTNRIAGVKAEESKTTYTGDAGNSNNVIDVTKYLATSKEEVIPRVHKQESLKSFNLSFSLPKGKEIDTRNYDLIITTENDFFSSESIKNFTFDDYFRECGYIGSSFWATELRPLKEGEVSVDIEVINRQNPSEKYYDTILMTFTDKYKGEKLVATKNEFNTKKNGLLIYNVEKGGYKEILNSSADDFQVGFHKADGSIVYPHELTVSTTDESVAVAGFTMTGKKFADVDISKFFPKYIDEFKTDDEYHYAVWGYLSSTGQCGGYGGAGDGKAVYSIIPRNAGTADVTFSYGDQSVTVKVNVSNTSETPVEKIPEDLANEFNNDNNASVNVSLTAPDTVKADVFKSAKETGKPVSFDIKGTDNKTQYAWTFNGKDITNPDMSLDLGIKFTSNKESNIRKLVNQENMMFLSFNHHGALPGKASMKINVSEKYKDGEYVFLNYFNEEKGIIESQGDKFLVKDGYVEFTIDHCSEYFLTTQPVSNSTIVEDTKPVEDDAIKNTGNVVTGDTTMPIVLFSLLIVSGSMFVVFNKKRALHKK